MNDEIREILYNLKVHNALADEEDTMLLNYITNLQQELEARQYDINNLTYQLVKEKSRREKVVELIKEAGCYDEKTKTFCDDIWEELPKILNTLNGKE